MSIDRRTLFKYTLTSLAAMHALGAQTRKVQAASPAETPIRIEPNPGYQRIACEEVWTTKEVVAAQVRRTGTDWVKRQPYVAGMTRGFSGNSRMQGLLQDLGPGRVEHGSPRHPEAGADVHRTRRADARSRHYPYQQDDFEVVATDTTPVPFEHKVKLYQTNAERLFNLKPVARAGRAS